MCCTRNKQSLKLLWLCSIVLFLRNGGPLLFFFRESFWESAKRSKHGFEHISNCCTKTSKRPSHSLLGNTRSETNLAESSDQTIIDQTVRSNRFNEYNQSYSPVYGLPSILWLSKCFQNTCFQKKCFKNDCFQGLSSKIPPNASKMPEIQTR